MSPITAWESVTKTSQIMFLVVIFLMIMCGTAVSAVESNPQPKIDASNVSLSTNQSSSVLDKSSVSLNSNMSNHDSLPHPSGEIVSKDAKKTENVTNTDCKSDSCIPASSSPEGVKVPSSNEMTKKLNPDALMRGFYVFAGLSAIVMVYIAWKSFGKRPAQVHRYGVVANREDLEMAPLDSDEAEGDDDDTTHFDLSKHRLT